MNLCKEVGRQHGAAINTCLRVLNSSGKANQSFSLWISFVASNNPALIGNTAILRKFVRDSNQLEDLFHVHCDKRNLGDFAKRSHIRDPGDKSSVKIELIKLPEFDLTVADFNLPLL